MAVGLYVADHGFYDGVSAKFRLDGRPDAAFLARLVDAEFVQVFAAGTSLVDEIEHVLRRCQPTIIRFAMPRRSSSQYAPARRTSA